VAQGQTLPHVDRPRTRALSVAECRRLLNPAAPEFRPMVRAAMLSGLRYGELCGCMCATTRVTGSSSRTAKRRHEAHAAHGGGRRIFRRSDRRTAHLRPASGDSAARPGRQSGAVRSSDQSWPGRYPAKVAELTVELSALRRFWPQLALLSPLAAVVVWKYINERRDEKSVCVVNETKVMPRSRSRHPETVKRHRQPEHHRGSAGPELW
jgi:hypothetical protein